jgi:hypothetical protein
MLASNASGRCRTPESDNDSGIIIVIKHWWLCPQWLHVSQQVAYWPTCYAVCGLPALAPSCHSRSQCGFSTSSAWHLLQHTPKASAVSDLAAKPKPNMIQHNHNQRTFTSNAAGGRVNNKFANLVADGQQVAPACVTTNKRTARRPRAVFTQ